MQITNYLFQHKYSDEKLNILHLWPTLWYIFSPDLRMFSRKGTVESSSSNFVQYGGDLTSIDIIRQKIMSSLRMRMSLLSKHTTAFVNKCKSFDLHKPQEYLYIFLRIF